MNIINSHHSSQPNLALSNRQSPVRASLRKDKQVRERGYSKNSKKSSVEDVESDVEGRSESPVKVKFIMNKKFNSNSKMKALEHLLPVNGEKQNTNNIAHITHQTWILKI